MWLVIEDILEIIEHQLINKIYKKIIVFSGVSAGFMKERHFQDLFKTE